jgi:heme-degrading monooxygenase HmoA
MLIALYEIVIKQGSEQKFEKAWADVTDAILRVRGSLGSKLHTTEAQGVYIAYAQWPSKELFDEGIGAKLFTETETNSLNAMKECSVQIKLLHTMKVCDDRLNK